MLFQNARKLGGAGRGHGLARVTVKHAEERSVLEKGEKKDLSRFPKNVCMAAAPGKKAPRQRWCPAFRSVPCLCRASSLFLPASAPIRDRRDVSKNKQREKEARALRLASSVAAKLNLTPPLLVAEKTESETPQRKSDAAHRARPPEPEPEPEPEPRQLRRAERQRAPWPSCAPGPFFSWGAAAARAGQRAAPKPPLSFREQQQPPPPERQQSPLVFLPEH